MDLFGFIALFILSNLREYRYADASLNKWSTFAGYFPFGLINPFGDEKPMTTYFSAANCKAVGMTKPNLVDNR
jgi:hypothetical protein